MKAFLLLSVSIAFLVFSSPKPTYSQTIVPGGYVSGTWTAAGSPYLVQGSITIHADSMLTIEPGVDVIFQGLYPLTVNGLLQAVGTETDYIHFFPADINAGWWGINFVNAPDSSHLAYCTVSYTGATYFGNGAIMCTNSNPVITHCQISNNTAGTPSLTFAGGIALNNSNAEISWCNITNNYSDQYGGGINIYNSSPLITGCNISDNEVVQYGGGVFIYGNSNPVITNCTIEGNTSNIYGGGISALGGVVNISECTIGYNHAETGGGGISIHGGNVFLDHCIIERNNCLTAFSNQKGGGIYTDGGTLTVDHCTFYWNEVEQSSLGGQELHTEGNAAMTVTNSIINSYWSFRTIVFNSSLPASVLYNDFKGESGIGPSFFYGNVPPGLGDLTTINANGDTCDVFYNTYLDPLFANPGSGDYHLTWANWPIPDSTKSPCIDAGDSSSPFDPDSTITDMGAFYFHQPGTIIPGGYVSGTWTAANSPYLIQGDITIHADSTLTIEPGVLVEFQGSYSFTVNGFLQAVGAATDSIRFTAVTTWMGLYFSNAPDSSHLAFCTISKGSTYGGIRCSYSNPVIIHSTISDNSSNYWGGGIWLQYSNPSIAYCTISNNYSNDYGGGIRMGSSSPNISNCSIMKNYGNTRGGGIYISLGNPSFDNCTISNNKSGVGGGIAFLDGGQVTITDCIITADTASFRGGGIYVSSPGGSLTINNSTINICKAPYGGGLYIDQAGSVFMTGCTFESNAVNNTGGGGAIYINQAGTVSMMRTTLDDNFCGSYPGGVIYSVNCSNLVFDHCDVVNNHGAVIEGGIHLNGNTAMTVKNCIFKNQIGSDIWFESYASASVMYSDFAGPNSPFAFPPPGLGTLVQTNINGDSCDVFYNIYLDPLFVDFPNSDYHLSWANWPTPDSTKSPCIDAGDPSSPYDPDSTITDMGQYSFDQIVPVELVSFTAELNEDNVVLKWSTATETNNSGFEIQRKPDNANWEKIGFVEGQGTTTEPNSYSFTDKNISTGIYLYRFKQIDYDGSIEYSNEVKVEVSVPLEFKLDQNYPNPFNPITTIKYSIPTNARFTIKVFDILGNEIETLVNGEKQAGFYKLTWNAEQLPSGVYLYQIKAGEFISTKKMILLK